MLFVRIDDVSFLVDDGVKLISAANVAVCRVVLKIFAGFFDVENAILTVNLAVKDSVDDRSKNQTLGFAWGIRKVRQRPLASQLGRKERRDTRAVGTRRQEKSSATCLPNRRDSLLHPSTSIITVKRMTSRYDQMGNYEFTTKYEWRENWPQPNFGTCGRYKKPLK